jgi:hypothetical protein
MTPRQDRTKAREYLKKHKIKLLKCNIDFVEKYIIKDEGNDYLKYLDPESLYIFSERKRNRFKRNRMARLGILKNV